MFSIIYELLILAVITPLLLIIVLFILLFQLQNKVNNLSESIMLLKKQTDIRVNPEECKKQVEFDQPACPINPQPIQQAPKTIKNTEKAPQPLKIEQEKHDMDIQNALLGNIFNKIGAVAIIIAAIIFIKLASPFIVITPLVKTILGYIAGAGMVGTSLYMHKTDKLRNYSEVLLGTGFSVLFITLFCGFSLFELYNSAVVLIFGGILLLLAYILAYRMKTISMIVIALIGGYLTPFVAQANLSEAFGFLIFLNILSLVYTLNYKNKNYINIINLLITMAILYTWSFDSPLNISYPVILWACYLGYDLFREKTNNIDNCVSWINYAVLTFFSFCIFGEFKMALGCLFISAAFVYMSLAAITKYLNMETLYKSYIYYVLLNAWLFIFFTLSDIQSIVSWSILAAVIIFVSKKFNQDYLIKISALYFASMVAKVLLAKYGDNFIVASQFPLFLNIRTLIFAFPICSMFYSGCLLKNKDEKIHSILNFGALSLVYIYFVCEISSLFSSNYSDMESFNKWTAYSVIGFIYSLNIKRLALNNKSLLYESASSIVGVVAFVILICISFVYPISYVPFINLRTVAFITAVISMITKARWSGNEAYKYIAIFAGFLFAHVESSGIVKVLGGHEYLISLSWMLYSGIATIFGIVFNRKYLINSGIAMIILSIFRIFVFDLAKVDALYKLIGFLALGILLMLVSYIYSKSKK